MSEYYDRQGNPMTLKQWANRLEGGIDEARVAETILPSGYWVSTVWLGLNHAFGSGPPLIFETMVFPCDKDGKVTSFGEMDSDRYSTETEALAGHARISEKWANGEPVSVDVVDPVGEKITG